MTGMRCNENRQVRALMAEADENEDGCVDWREFLPAFLPLLRSAQVLLPRRP